ncbi:hypothetical protein V8E54_003876 [Elaphomyces granulatus]
MSGASTSGMKPAKTMSSRLLTMKFMQRAAASAVAKTTTSTTNANAASTGPPLSRSPPRAPRALVAREEFDGPSPKRPRLSTNSNRNNKDNAPSPAAPSASDLQAISAAIASEEQKRTEAIARQAAEAGETEWVLEFAGAGESHHRPVPSISSYAYGGSRLDTRHAGQLRLVPASSWDAGDEDLLDCGRRSYGNFKRRKSSQRESDSSESDSEDDGSAEFSEIDMTDPVQIEAMIERAKARAERKARQKKKKAKNPEDFKLSRLTSISGARGAISKPASSHHNNSHNHNHSHNHKFPDRGRGRGSSKRGRRG